MRRKKLAYHHRLHQLISDKASWSKYSGTGDGLTIWLLVGSQAWEWASIFRDLSPARLFVMFPPDQKIPPSDYDWSLIASHDPILIQPCGETDHNQVRQIVKAMMHQGVRRVLYLTEPRFTRFVASEVSNAA